MFLLDSFLVYLLKFFVSKVFPLRLMTDDLPSCARVWMTLHNATFFGVEVLFLNFHFLLI